MFFGIDHLATFVLGTIFIVLLPGPNSMYVMSVASRRGVGAGYGSACGVFLGDTILMVLAATGVASLIEANPLLFTLLKYGGAAYLAYLGINLLRAAVARWRGQESAGDGAATGEDNGARPFRRALVISLLNPKAILFYLSFFIQFVSPGYAHPGLSFLVLGAIVQLCSVLYLSALIFGGSYLAEAFRRRRRMAAGATGSVGGLFIGFALKLAEASLS